MTCIVCGNKLTHKIFNPGPQPLAALNLPKSAAMAQSALRFPMNFHMCAFCGHVFNTDFNYAQVPYAADSNLMYNSGPAWQNHMQMLVNKLHTYKDRWISGVAIDIGCGDGQFFSRLLGTMPNASCIGYEPGIEADQIKNFSVFRDYFIPERDLARFRPSLLVCRHVIEHMDKPREFLAEISYWCSVYNLSPIFLVEVPCFDNSLALGRISDFLYEHVSNFTSNSFQTLFSQCGYSTLDINRYYGNEVLAGFFTPNSVPLQFYTDKAKAFGAGATDSISTVQRQLEEIKQQKKTLVFWGGTGKSAAFLNSYGIDSTNYPLVVDSDVHKVGKFVPGTGQEIQSPDIIKAFSDPIIVITTPWRAKDIKLDIEYRGIKYRRLLILQEGILCEYNN
jgi:hypothetical protein